MINEYKITFEVISKSNFDSGVRFEASVYISGTDIEYAKSLLKSSHLEVLKHLSTIKVATKE